MISFDVLRVLRMVGISIYLKMKVELSEAGKTPAEWTESDRRKGTTKMIEMREWNEREREMTKSEGETTAG